MDVVMQTDRSVALVFAACGTLLPDGSTTAAVYRVIDSNTAVTWTAVLNPANMGRTSLALAPSKQDIIYAVSASNSTSGNFSQGLLAVYQSISSGRSGTWTTQTTNASPTTQNTLLLTSPISAVAASCGLTAPSTTLNSGWYDSAIAVDPKNPNTVWVGGVDLFRSDDAGQTWGIASWWSQPASPSFVHADQHAIAFHPLYDGSANQTMYVAGDGGVFRSVNAAGVVSYSPNPITPTSAICGNPATGSVTWTALNNGIQ
jgi:hypothetical protein